MSSVNKGTEISFSPLGLQTILFALSGSGSFIFALRGVELITQSDAETLLIKVITVGTKGPVTIDGEVSVASMKDVFCSY